MTEKHSIVMEPIGIVRSSRSAVVDDHWDAENMFIELDSRFSEETMAGLTDFSHVEVIFYMNQQDTSKVENTARHPRNNEAWPKVGIFAQRNKGRPNQIGLTICRIVKVEGRMLHLEGLDAVDTTPVLDIKPWVAEYAPRGTTFQPTWISELMSGYWS